MAHPRSQPKRSRPMGHPIVGGLLLIIGILLGEPSLAQEAPLAVRVKVAFIYNFTRFIEWPRDGGGQAPLNLCVAGDSLVYQTLSETVTSKSRGGRPIEAHYVADRRELGGCQLLYVAGDSRSASYWQAPADQALLTVGDSPGFIDEGGSIGFVIDAGKVRFEINQREARARQLQISSKLLSLAQRVLR